MKVGDLIPEAIRDHFDCESVSVIQFWSRSCPSCHNNMPRIVELDKEYSEKGKLNNDANTI
ncbi:MAG: hypothetical protein QM758_18530 [Armatimonas sp.]